MTLSGGSHNLVNNPLHQSFNQSFNHLNQSNQSIHQSINSNAERPPTRLPLCSHHPQREQYIERPQSGNEPPYGIDTEAKVGTKPALNGNETHNQSGDKVIGTVIVFCWRGW